MVLWPVLIQLTVMVMRGLVERRVVVVIVALG